MTARVLIAYGLIALLALFAVGLALWTRHNTFARKDGRRRLRDNARYQRRDGPPAGDEGSVPER